MSWTCQTAFKALGGLSARLGAGTGSPQLQAQHSSNMRIQYKQKAAAPVE
jgi:hypothetical protein